MSLFPLTAIVFSLNTTAIIGPDPHPAPLSFRQNSTSVSIRTEQQYFAALRAADSTTFQNEFQLEFLLLLDKELKQSYDSLSSLDARKAWIELYWRAENPDPLLAENDWLKTFLIRRAYARKNFPAKTPPYFDDRGKYYLKYGKPAFRYEDSGGFKHIAFLGNHPEASYTVVANESWSYENVARDFVVHFIREGTTFREIPSLTDLIRGAKRARLSWQWSDLIKQRASISPVLGRAALQIEEFETAFRHAALSGNAALLRSEFVLPQERLFEIVRTNEHELNKASRAAPAAAHDPIKAVNRLSFYNTISQFRGPEGRTRVEIALLAPFKKNFVDRLDSLVADTLDLEFACLLRNQNFDALTSDHVQKRIPMKLAALNNLPHAVGNLSFVAVPQSGELTLQIHDKRRDRIGFSKQPLDLRDFSGGALMVSDVQFFMEATHASQREVLPLIEKQNLVIVPYPYSWVRKTIPLLCYFEIYNLQSAGIANEYEIAYRVFTIKGDEPFLERLSKMVTGSEEVSIRVAFTQPVIGENSQELIAIDLSNLQNGKYWLEVAVADAKDKSITAKALKEVIVVD